MSAEPESKPEIKNVIPASLVTEPANVDSLVVEFLAACEPLEKTDIVYVFVDARTGARFCECHIRASKFIPAATVDVPIDPEHQEEYRANRDLVESHQAFKDMKLDVYLIIDGIHIKKLRNSTVKVLSYLMGLSCRLRNGMLWD